MTIGRASLWLRWSWRDLRARVLQVAAIAGIVALGTGVYAGLSSTSEWRRSSYPASYEALNAHDVHVTLARDTYVAPDDLQRALESAPAPVRAAETRLVVPTQVDASQPGRQILVPGRIVGLDLAAGAPRIDTLDVVQGDPLPDDGSAVLLDEHFARHHDLPPQGTLRLSGERTVRYSGTALSPEYFMVMSEQGTLLAEAAFAVVFAPRSLAEDVSGRPGLVNDAVVALEPGSDARAAADAIAAHLEDALPDVATTVTPLEEERPYRILFDDIDGDQRLYDIFAFLILGGAAFAAFNLVGRVVEAQRREIGIGMALGVPRAQLAVRPLLVGFQVALIGALLGVAVGYAVGAVMRSILVDFFPLPVWNTPFELGTYARGLLVGVTLPFLATLLPVWRAVRVAPVDAIRTGPTTVKRSGLAPLLRRFTVGDSLRRLPLRNVLRAPRRTLLTAFAIAAAIGTLVGVIGMLDSFLGTIDTGEEAVLGETRDRLTVELSAFAAESSPELQAVTGAPGVGRAEPELRVGGSMRGADGDGDEIDTVLSLVDLEAGMARPGLREGTLDPDRPGVVLAEKAARDLDVGVGDEIVLRHPFREGVGYRWVESPVRVEAIHAIPYRFVTYMDLRDAGMMNLAGIYNTFSVTPDTGVSVDDVQRTLFEVPGVASVQPVETFAKTIRDTVNEFLDILDVVRAAVLLLALLIAFNTSAINTDERAREHATMFAFGVPMRTVIGSNVAESAIVGVLGSAFGIALGFGIVNYITSVLLPTTLPDISVEPHVSSATIVTAAVLGILAVAVAPLLTVRRLRRMNVPATLRVVE